MVESSKVQKQIPIRKRSQHVKSPFSCLLTCGSLSTGAKYVCVAGDERGGEGRG